MRRSPWSSTTTVRAAGCATTNTAQLAATLTTALAGHGIELLAAHVVDRVAAGWTLALRGRLRQLGHGRRPVGVTAGGGGRSGRAPTLCPARRTAGGHRRRRSRPQRSVADVIRGRKPDAPDVRTRRHARYRGRDGRGRAGGRGGELSDAELARLACALTDPRVRDTLYALAVGEDAAQAESLWAMLARTLPEPWRVEALVLLAFSAYARGDGPLAGVVAGGGAALRTHPPDGGHARHRAAIRDAARTDPRTGGHRVPAGRPARGAVAAAPGFGRQAG